jgi:hypothetical protein
MVVSENEKLTDEEKFKMLGGIAGSALGLGLGSFAVLAARGLVHPDEVEGIFSTLLGTIDQLPANVRESMPYNLLQSMADVKRVAAANWKSNG